MSKARILLVDDEQDYLDAIKDRCVHIGYEVITAGGGVEGLEKAQSTQPEAIVLDIMMPDMSGWEVLNELRRHDSTAEIPIIMLSTLREEKDIVKGYDGGADVYKVKPDAEFIKDQGFSELLVPLWRAIVQYRRRSFIKSVVSVECGSNFLHYSVQGAASVPGRTLPVLPTEKTWHKEMARLAEIIYDYHDSWLRERAAGNAEAAAMYLKKRQSWRWEAANKGREFYKAVFEQNIELFGNWSKAQLAAGDAGVVLRFGGTRNNLVLPFELMHDRAQPLVTKFPVSRQVSEPGAARPSWRSFLTSRQGKTIRVLLLASDELGARELPAVAQKLVAAMERVDVRLEVTPDKLDRPVTLDEAVSELSRKSYHVVHYAGHAVHLRDRPDLSHLYFRDKEGKAAALSATQLNGLLAGSEVQFLYLSCCSGAEIANDQVLDENAYLGLLDATIQAGVPAALGYRWPVVGRSARFFASSFYEGLLHYPSSFEHATWWARKHIFEVGVEGGWDDTWISPILIVQNPDSLGADYV